MPLVDVRNENVHPFNQMWRERSISIPAGGAVEMEYDDAELFLGHYSPIVRDGDGRPDPRSYKKLVIVPRGQGVPQRTVEAAQFRCHACNYNALSKWDLEGHTLELHAEQLADEETRKEALEKKAGPKGAQNGPDQTGLPSRGKSAA